MNAISAYAAIAMIYNESGREFATGQLGRLPSSTGGNVCPGLLWSQELGDLARLQVPLNEEVAKAIPVQDCEGN